MKNDDIYVPDHFYTFQTVAHIYQLPPHTIHVLVGQQLYRRIQFMESERIVSVVYDGRDMTDKYYAMHKRYDKITWDFEFGVRKYRSLTSTILSVCRLVWFTFKKYVFYCESNGHKVRYSLLYSIFFHFIEYGAACKNIEKKISLHRNRVHLHYKIWRKARDECKEIPILKSILMMIFQALRGHRFINFNRFNDQKNDFYDVFENTLMRKMHESVENLEYFCNMMKRNVDSYLGDGYWYLLIMFWKRIWARLPLNVDFVLEKLDVVSDITILHLVKYAWEYDPYFDIYTFMMDDIIPRTACR